MKSARRPVTERHEGDAEIRGILQLLLALVVAATALWAGHALASAVAPRRAPAGTSVPRLSPSPPVAR